MDITTDTRSGPVRINPTGWSAGFGFDQAQLRPAPTAVLTVAGQGPTDADGVPLHAGDVTAQLALAIHHVEELLDAADMDLRDVLRMTLYTTDVDATLAGYGALLERLDRVGATPPTTLLGVAALALPGMAVQIEVTAAR